MTVAIAGLRKSFGGAVALAGVDLTIGANEIHALLGPNGAGKSTLIRCMGGAISPDAGSICIDDTCYDSLTPAQALRAGVAVIYQNLSLISSLSVAENVFLGAELRNGPFVDFARQRQRASAILAQLGADGVSPSAIVSELPVALQQLVEIARALNRADVRLLILDEPTAALSETEAHALADRLRALKERGVHILYITHLLREVLDVADVVTVIRDGRVAFTSTVKDTSYQELVSAIAPAASQARHRQERLTGTADVALETRALSGDRFGPVSLRLRQGEIVALFGLVGSGRTEFLETLFGARVRTSGDLLVHGASVRFRDPSDAIRVGMALVPAERIRQGILGTLSVLDNLLLPAYARLSRRGFRDRAGERTMFDNFARAFRLVPARSDAKLQELSGGNQQKVVVGRWLEAMPQTRIVLLDEPTMGIDVGTRREIYEIMGRSAHDEGRAILFASSDPEEVVAVADRAIVLLRGKPVAELQAGELAEDALLALAHGGSPSQRPAGSATEGRTRRPVERPRAGMA